MDYEQLYQQAVDYVTREDWKGAVQRLEKIAEKYEKYHEMNYLLGKTYYRLGRYEESLERLKLANAQTPDSHLVACFTGLAYGALQDYEKALEYLNRAISLDPKNDVYHFNMAVHFWAVDDTESALKFINQALKLNPKDPEYHFQKGEFLSYIDQPKEARKCYEQVLKLDKRKTEALLELARCYSMEQEYQKSVDYYQAYMNDKNTREIDATVYIETGNSLYQLGEYDQAIAKLKKAHELDPDEATIYNGLGNAYSAIGETDAARENFLRAIKIQPQEPIFRYNAALFYSGIEDYRQAWTHASYAADFFTESQETLEMLKEIETHLKPEDIEAMRSRKRMYFGTDTIEGAIEDLNQLVGMSAVKKEIESLVNTIKINEMRESKGLNQQSYTHHMVFAGPPGTGKTTVARKLGNIFKLLGILEKGHVIEVDRPELVAEYSGQTAVKTNKVIDSAMDGILFVDEAYSLTKSGSKDSFGSEAVDTLLKRMEDDRKRLIVIAAGYDAEMREFLKSNPGLDSRFVHHFYFEDYKPEELLELFTINCEENDYIVTPELKEELQKYFKKVYQGREKNFGNGRFVRTLLEKITNSQAQRLAEIEAPTHQDLLSLLPEDLISAVPELANEDMSRENVKTVLDKIKSYIGMASVKKDIQNMLNFIKIEKMRAEQGAEKSSLSMHMIFAGPPGTGKTTIARELGKVFKAMGILSKGHLIEVDRAELVAEYVGQTAVKTSRVIDAALDGILFIDEAYTLYQPNDAGNDFGKEAIETLLKRMEDSRDRLIVIAAGYEEEMQGFIAANPGLESRFTRKFRFPDYTPAELLELFKLNCREKKFVLGDGADEAALAYFKKAYDTRSRNFGNGRFVRNFFERVMQEQSNRLAQMDNPDSASLYDLVKADIQAAQ